MGGFDGAVVTRGLTHDQASEYAAGMNAELGMGVYTLEPKNACYEVGLYDWEIDPERTYIPGKTKRYLDEGED